MRYVGQFLLKVINSKSVSNYQVVSVKNNAFVVCLLDKDMNHTNTYLTVNEVNYSLYIDNAIANKLHNNFMVNKNVV